MFDKIIDEEGNFFRTTLLFTKEEIEKVKNNFCWTMGPEDFVIDCGDYFSQQQKEVLKKTFPQIDLPIDDLRVNFSEVFDGIFFTMEEYVKELTFPIRKGPSFFRASSIVPIDGRPTHEYGDIYIWYDTMGLLKRIDPITKKTKGFFHPVTNRLLFKKEEEYSEFLKKHEKLTKSIKKMIPKDSNYKYFIRVIGVYDKETEELKYRIINDDFDAHAVGQYALKPYPGDEDLYFRSYEVNKKIAKYINNNYYNPIDFNFEKNRYFLETLAAENFMYPYEEFIKDLELRNKG